MRVQTNGAGSTRMEETRRLEKAPQNERRSRPRYPVAAKLAFKTAVGACAGELAVGETVNLSSTGLLFRSETAVAPGTPVEIAIPWTPGGADPPITLHIQGIALWARANLIAVKIVGQSLNRSGMRESLQEHSFRRTD